MIIFLASEAMLFAGLLGAYFVLRWTENGFPWQPGGMWPPEGVDIKLPVDKTAIATAFLLGSSVTYHMAEVAVRKGKAGLGWLVGTLFLGTIFIGFQCYEWWHLHHEGLWFNQGGVFGATFFVITGFHGMHVVIGVALILWVLLRQVFTRCYTPERHVSLNNVGLYWHFVDVVWIFVFTLLYFV
ncbi:MAG: cytochrome c oxidase subunit 3 [Terrimicrobiaceae bacterium]